MRSKKPIIISDITLKKRTFNWLVTKKFYSISNAALAMDLTDDEVDIFTAAFWGC